MIYFLLLLAPGNCLTFRRAFKDMRFDASTSVIFFFHFISQRLNYLDREHSTTQSRRKVCKMWGAEEGSKKVNWWIRFCVLCCQKLYDKNYFLLPSVVLFKEIQIDHQFMTTPIFWRFQNLIDIYLRKITLIW